MTIIQTFIVEPSTPELAICARWRANAFSVLQASFEQELRSMELFASDQGRGVALVAKADGEPIGTCLLAESEIEPNHDVSPWLAGLFVVPEHRRKGAGAVLVRAIEDQARQRGFSRLYLYTTEAVEFYARLGWTVVDHTNWKGFDTALMVRDLSQPGADKENAA
jgi:GNAT superfamily N-acetyltransferase